jgi:hypothetical protein
MVDVDSSGAAAVQRRRTWMTGGVLLLASVLLGPALVTVPGAWAGWLSALLFAAALVTFAVGFGNGPGGSITARRPLGTGALIVLAVWSVVWPWAIRLIVSSAPAVADPGDVYYASVQMFSITGEVVSLILAIIAVIQIGRTRAVPRPWNWAPLWALAAVTIGPLLSSLFVAGPITPEQDVLIAISILHFVMSLAAPAFLGVLAIVLATRRDPASVVVY